MPVPVDEAQTVAVQVIAVGGANVGLRVRRHALQVFLPYVSLNS